MTDHLSEAREIAKLLRFSADAARPRVQGDASHLASILDIAHLNELRICKEVTPGLSAALTKVCSRLAIPEGVLHAFAYPSPDIQAECHAGTTTECAVRFSSTLLDRLDNSEFEFVAGHEVGHFLLAHNLMHAKADSKALEYYMQSRYQEISVDRIGLIACGSLEVGISALMKTLSGLTERHLRFDVGAFISQLENTSSLARRAMSIASHPPILVRCRALIWFSLSDYFANGPSEQSREELSRIDSRIMSDMNKYVDREAREVIQAAKDELALWSAAFEIVQRGVFSKSDQALFSDTFGCETLVKLKNFLSETRSSEVENIVYSKVKAARDGLEILIPGSIAREVESVQNDIHDSFSKSS